MQNLLTIQSKSDFEASGTLETLGLQAIRNELDGFSNLAIPWNAPCDQM